MGGKRGREGGRGGRGGREWEGGRREGGGGRKGGKDGGRKEEETGRDMDVSLVHNSLPNAWLSCVHVLRS